MNNYSKQLIEEDDIQAAIAVMQSDHLTQGKTSEEFENALCRYVGKKYAVVFNSATSALHGAYFSIGIEQDDEVITTPISFAATSNAAIYCGGKPVFCDIKCNGNIDENKIESLITPKTKAIVPVDFGGNPVEIEKIKETAEKHNLYLIEDACHALGSEFNGKKVGSFANISIFSFHAIKPITTFEGGALLTDDKEIYEKAKLFRSHGIVKKSLWNSDMKLLGYNYRLNDVACAVGISQLKKLDTFIDKRTEIATYYDKTFQNNPDFSTIKTDSKHKSSYHLYPILLHRELWCSKEDIFQNLRDEGIGVQVHYKPIYQNSFYKEIFGEQRLKNAEEFYKAELSIPCHQSMDLKDAEFIVKTVFEVMEEQKVCA